MATGICTRVDTNTGRVKWILPDQTEMAHGTQFWLTLLVLSGLLAAPLLSPFGDLSAMFLWLPLLLVPPLLLPFHRRLRQLALSESAQQEIWRKGWHSVLRLLAVSMIAMYGGWLVALAALELVGPIGWLLTFGGVFWLRQKTLDYTFDF